MRKPFKQRSPATQTVQTRSVPAPVGGWNTRDPYANMAPTDALLLENIVCRTANVELRKGILDFKTGLGTTVESLITYRSPTTQKMFACSSAGIYDASLTGAFGAALIALTSGKMESTNITTAGGSFTLAVNGVDAMKSYNGTAWSNAAITGSTISSFSASMFNNISQFKHRIFLTANNSLSFFYMGIDSIAGEVKEYPLGALFPKGGSLLSCMNWTVDGGEGADDYCIFITTEGEVAVFKGTDPSLASQWSHQGTYSLPRPLGKRCLCKYGGDVLIITEAGVFPISKALQSSSIDRRIAISDKIASTFNASALTYAANHGWEAVLFQKEALLIFNIPISDGVSANQYVMNTLTGAWSKFTGLDANCFTVYNNNLYYGSSGKVIQALTGSSDNGSVVTGRAQQAYNYFGMRGGMKHVELLRPILESSGSFLLGLAIATDFGVLPVATVASVAGNVSSGVFDTALWDTATWGYDRTTEASWRTVAAPEGTALSLLLTLASNHSTVAWDVTDFGFASGSLLG